MAREVQAREDALKQLVRELTIEIDPAAQAKQVAEVIDTDFFRNLQIRARTTRGSRTFEQVPHAVADVVPFEDSGRK